MKTTEGEQYICFVFWREEEGGRRADGRGGEKMRGSGTVWLTLYWMRLSMKYDVEDFPPPS